MKTAPIVALVILILIAAGCGSEPVQAPTQGAGQTSGQTSGQTANKAPQEDKNVSAYVKQINEPVTLTAYLFPAQKLIFDDYVIPGLKKKYPKLTVDIVQSDKVSLEDLIASGQLPDLYAAQDLSDLIDVKLTTDLTGLIRKHQFNLSAIDPVLIESVKGYSTKGELLALPAGRSVNSLVYSKDIFNKFGVAFPKDGMKWDETISLAGKMTRSEGGIQYYGLHPNNYSRFSSELELTYFDKTGKAKVTTDGWQKVAKTWKDIMAIPNNKPVQKNPATAFTKDKNTAMILRNPLFVLRDSKVTVDWDLAAFPTYENNVGPDELGAIMGVTSVSKHQDEAFLVLDYYYSDEFQLDRIRSAEFIPLSADPSVQKHFGEDVPELRAKNLQSLFVGKRARTVIEKNQNIAGVVMTKALDKMTENNEDINTTLRTAEEEINKAVAESGK
jgi:multiple sugar transport system substrate-binding protein